jgi:hypothetical protein
MRSVREAVGEFFTMRETTARAERVASDEKEVLSRVLRRASESRVGASTLWVSGSPALAYRALVEAWSSANEAARRAAAVDEAAPLSEVVRALGVRASIAEEIVATGGLLGGIESPESDETVTAAHARAFPRIDAAAAALIEAATPAALKKNDLRRLRRGRIARAVGVGALVVAAAAVGWKSRASVRADASGTYTPKYEPMRVLDGNRDSEWLLPDQTAGWIDLHLSRPRVVNRVRLLNARIHPYYDRATHEFTIELWAQGRLVRTIDGAFAAFSNKPEPLVVEASSGNEKISRVRVVVKSWFMRGGGLGEVWIE